MDRPAEDAQGAVWRQRLERGAGPLLGALVALLYLPSLAGGYLPYDDDWLIERNTLLDAPFGEALWAIFFDFSRATRLTLGAEYLPLRDLSHLCEVALFGKSALGMRLVQLGLYLGALGLLRAALQKRVTAVVAWVSVACFALHPIHVESVAWLAGRKDVLALLFVNGALACYVQEGRARWWAVPLVMAAALSKSMSVICPGLLLAMDLLDKRRPAWLVLLSCGAVASLVFLLHLKVGASVGMVGGPLGESRVVAFWTMGEVWLRYLVALGNPPSLSVIYDVAPVLSASALSVAGWFAVAGTAGYAGWRALRGETWALAVATWAWLPLLPVSQVLVPLQNVMADRYLWLSCLALGLLLGKLWNTHVAARVAVLVALAVFAFGSLERAELFGDPAALFADASRKASGPRAPYQLGYALAQQGDADAAVAAYVEALARVCNGCVEQRNAANNLATLYVGLGEPELAEPVLRRSVERYPDDPKTAFNLVKVLARVGKTDEAQRLYEAATARFPGYAPGG